MAVGVKLLHIFYNNLIKLIHRIVLSPFQTLRRRKCTDFLKFFSYSENGSSADSSCLKSLLNIWWAVAPWVFLEIVRNISYEIFFKDLS